MEVRFGQKKRSVKLRITEMNDVKCDDIILSND